MSEWLSRVINKSEAEGWVQGFAESYARVQTERFVKSFAESFAEDYTERFTESFFSAGWKKGAFDTLAQLVKDQLLPVSEAAKRCNMTEVDFCEKAGIQVQQ